MRVEDLDTQRVHAAGTVATRQLADLTTLGLTWDTGPLRQSERLPVYAAAVAQLKERTYECFCTRREIAEASSAPHGGLRPYPGTCSHLNREQAARQRRTRPGAIRIRSGGGAFTVSGIHAGAVTALVDDFVLVRGDGTPAYNLAVVVDDMSQSVTRITRGADLLSSAPRQAWLTHLLGGTPPEYAHIGMVTNAAGARLAKRDGSVTLANLADDGRSCSDVLAMLSESLGLGPCRSVEEALAAMPGDSLPDARFWAAAVWDGKHIRPTSVA